eukprot:TRINITY_DN27430_c0_g2_i1.p1 TRINITY_DN27430_c0_g2~~TRINITY_DN27430_c0_g2_i1.p1  ORF type:complete len:196 (+),score=25.44 TRINITY_DN27430_c0_g2_i1:55-588(+)
MSKSRYIMERAKVEKWIDRAGYVFAQYTIYHKGVAQHNRIDSFTEHAAYRKVDLITKEGFEKVLKDFVKSNLLRKKELEPEDYSLYWDEPPSSSSRPAASLLPGLYSGPAPGLDADGENYQRDDDMSRFFGDLPGLDSDCENYHYDDRVVSNRHSDDCAVSSRNPSLFGECTGSDSD